MGDRQPCPARRRPGAPGRGPRDRLRDLEQPSPADADDLRRLRQTLGWTRERAADRLGIDPSALKRVEAGLELPPDPKRMARVYGLTAAELAAVVRRTRG